MSEYQCYEFVALDRPLTAKQVAELRAISTRAEISRTRFWNEYQWGDLKADPAKLMARYFDAHLYFANWGTHRLMLRMPKARVDLKALRPYFGKGCSARLKSVGDHVLLDLSSDAEAPEDDDQRQGSLAALSPLRTELMRGDLRPAYLAWLLSVSEGDVKGETIEPPVPPGLAELTAPQEAMVEFLRIDVDLVAVASRGRAAATDDGAVFHRWVMALSVKEKDVWLRRAAEELDLAIGGELLRAFRRKAKRQVSEKKRTVGQLRTLAKAQRAERERAEAARKAKVEAVFSATRERHLTKLARDIDGAWAKFEKFVAANRYDEAVALAVDLRDLAAHDGKEARFAGRFEAMRQRQHTRRGFFDRWKRANERRSGEP